MLVGAGPGHIWQVATRLADVSQTIAGGSLMADPPQHAEQPASPCSPLGTPGTQPLAFGSPATFGSPAAAARAPEPAPDAPFGSGASLEPPTFGAPRALLHLPAPAAATSLSLAAAQQLQQHPGAGQGALVPAGVPGGGAPHSAFPAVQPAGPAGAAAQTTSLGPFGRSTGADSFRCLASEVHVKGGG